MSRNRHDRILAHFGAFESDVVLLASPVGHFPAGTPVTDVLEWISQQIDSYEGGPPVVGAFGLGAGLAGRLFLDAILEEASFWQDTFTRSTYDASIDRYALSIGQNTGGPYLFTWDRVIKRFNALAYAYVSGGVMWLELPDAAYQSLSYEGYVGFTGYPAISRGTVRFDFYTPDHPLAYADYSIMPMRSDHNPTYFGVYNEQNYNGTNYDWQVYYDDYYLTVGLEWGEWYTVEFLFGGNGDPTAYRIWQVGTARPDWTGEQVTTGGPFDSALPNLDMGGSWYGAGLDNLFLTRLDSDPWQIHRQVQLDATIAARYFRLDAVLALRFFRLDAMLSKTIAQQALLDAVIAALPGFTFDAVLHVERSASLTFDARLLRLTTEAATLDAVVAASTTPARLSQAVVEAIRNPVPDARTSQQVVEAVRSPSPDARVSQTVVEVIKENI